MEATKNLTQIQQRNLNYLNEFEKEIVNIFNTKGYIKKSDYISSQYNQTKYEGWQEKIHKQIFEKYDHYGIRISQTKYAGQEQGSTIVFIRDLFIPLMRKEKIENILN